MNPRLVIRAALFFSSSFVVAGLLLIASARADGGNYSINFSAANTKSYQKFVPSTLACSGQGRVADPINPPTGEGVDNARFGSPKDSVESLEPSDLGLGQIVPYELKICASGNVGQHNPENGTIDFKVGFSTETTNGSAFGFDSGYSAYCAFVDPSDLGGSGLDGNETVTNISSVTLADEFQSTIRVAGLDDGDCAIVEVWVVLQDQIPPSVQGNVQSRLISAQTVLGSTISTGSQTIPLKKVRNFFESKADVNVVVYILCTTSALC